VLHAVADVLWRVSEEVLVEAAALKAVPTAGAAAASTPNSTQETRTQTALDDVASNISQTLPG